MPMTMTVLEDSPDDAVSVIPPRPPAPRRGTWVVRDGNGDPVGEPWADRAAALRSMGTMAVHGACLPLLLHGPDGQPTGDRLG